MGVKGTGSTRQQRRGEDGLPGRDGAHAQHGSAVVEGHLPRRSLSDGSRERDWLSKGRRICGRLQHDRTGCLRIARTRQRDEREY